MISNYYNGYSFLSWSSFNDFVSILDDLLLLGEYQNFDREDRERIGAKFELYFKDSDLGKKYPYIPTDGRHCNFCLQ